MRTRTLKSKCKDFTYQTVFPCVGEHDCICRKKKKKYCGSRWSYTKADKLPQVMSASIWAEEYRFEEEVILPDLE